MSYLMYMYYNAIINPFSYNECRLIKISKKIFDSIDIFFLDKDLKFGEELLPVCSLHCCL